MDIARSRSGIMVRVLMIGLVLSVTVPTASWAEIPGRAAPSAEANAPAVRPPLPSRVLPLRGPAPPGLPDLVIAHAAVTMTCSPSGLKTAKITAVVMNQGAIAADLSTIPFGTIVDVDWRFTAGSGHLESANVSAGMKSGAVGGPMQLEPNGVFLTTITISGIPKVANPAKLQQTHPGAEYGFKITADPLNMVPEANEANNTKLLYVPSNQCT